MLPVSHTETEPSIVVQSQSSVYPYFNRPSRVQLHLAAGKVRAGWRFDWSLVHLEVYSKKTSVIRVWFQMHLFHNSPKLFRGNGSRSLPCNGWVAGLIPAPCPLGKTLHLPYLLLVVRGPGGAGTWQPLFCGYYPVACHYWHVSVRLNVWITIVWSALGSSW